MKLKTGDTVVVIAGKDKGKQGRITKTIKSESRVVVEGINMIKRSTKPNGMNNEGGIIEREAAIHMSNVMLVDPKTKKPTRKRVETTESVKKEKTETKPKKVTKTKKKEENLD